MQQRNRLRVFLAAITLTGLSWSALPGLAVPVTVYTDELVFRGGPGETRTWTWVNDPAHIGQLCTVTATVENGESEHAGNVLDVGPLRAVEIEAEPFGVTVVSGQVTLGETGAAFVTLSDDPAHAWRPPTDRRPGVWVFSGRLTVEVTCTQGSTTTTSTSTSSSSTSTTTPPSTSTSTSTPPASSTSTTAPPATTSTTTPNPTTSVPATTSTTTPGPTTSTVPTSSTVPSTTTSSSTVPPITGSTLPFTGPPVEPASVGMAAAALLLLGGWILRAARSGA